MLTLVLGGARSGKSRHAQLLCGSRAVVYIATAHANDDAEMDARIARHRASRPAAWTTVEEPLDVVKAVASVPSDATVALVECVTVWLANLMWEYRALESAELEARVLHEVEAFAAIARLRDVIAVSNEVGCGLVPDNQVGRTFRDLQGLANQRLAREAERVDWLVAGIPFTLKRHAESSAR